LPVLLLFDVSLGVKSFLDFQAGSTFVQGIKVEANDAPMMRTLAEWDKANRGGLCIIEDYWFPCLAIRRNGKMVLTSKNDTYFLVSGMEIPNPDRIDSNMLRKYADKKVLLVVKKEQTRIFALFPGYDFSVREKKGGFFVFEGTPCLERETSTVRR